MTNKVGDWIKEDCNTVGQGVLTLIGADDGFARFGDVFNSVEQVWYIIIDGINTESGQGTFNGVSQITRDNVHATIEGGSYNGNNPDPIYLNGEAVVACAFTAQAYNDINELMESLNERVDNAEVDIALNASHIAQNVEDILQNSADIGQNAEDILQNTTDIATNTSNISDNTSGIQDLEVNVSYRESSISALEFGGLITPNGPTTILIAAGQGEVINSYDQPEDVTYAEVSWVEMSFDLLPNGGMPKENGLGYTEIAMDINGDPVAIANGLSDAQRRDVIRLGAVEYIDRSVIQVIPAPIVSNQAGNTFLDMMAFTPISDHIKGMVLRPTDIGNLSMWRDIGELFAVGVNYEISKASQNVRQIAAAGSPLAEISMALSTYNNGDMGLGAVVEVVPPDSYELDGLGTITPLPANGVTIHYLYQSLTGDRFYFSYGQRSYSSYEDALNNLFSDRASHLVPIELSNFLQLGQMVVGKGAIVWDDIEAAIYPANSSTSSGSIGGSAANAINVNYSDTHALGSNVQVAIDSLAALKLTPDQHDGINEANAPSSTNPYATILDIDEIDAGLVDEVQGGNLITVDSLDPTRPIVNHDTGDGLFHVPENGTTNSGKVLTAGAVAGETSWEDLTATGTNLDFTSNLTEGVVSSDTGTDATIPASTPTNAGLFEANDKTKLNGIEIAANNYTHPIGSGNNHMPAGGVVGQIIINTEAGDGSWQDLDIPESPPTNLGYVAAPTSGQVTSSTGTNATIPGATTSLAGVMTGFDKSKLDTIQAGANVSFPTGTGLVFYQAAAPTGWVKDTSKNDFMLRSVSGNGGGFGGSDSAILNNKVTSHTHSVTGTAVSTGNHTHNVTGSVASDGAHTHTLSGSTGADGAHNHHSGIPVTDAVASSALYGKVDTPSAMGVSAGQNRTEMCLTNSASTHTHTLSGSAASDGDHTHSITSATAASDGSHSHTLSASASANTGASNWTPQYVDVILAHKP